MKRYIIDDGDDDDNGDGWDEYHHLNEKVYN
jgi:hypothetical protein